MLVWRPLVTNSSRCPTFRRAAEAEAARLAAEALREETAVRRDVIEALHRRVEELERELAMRDAFQEA